MEQRKEELKRRPLYVYDLPKDILATLQRRERPGLDPANDSTQDGSLLKTSPGSTSAPSWSSKSCSLCGESFQTVEEQRGHTRSDFHNFNLKQKLQGLRSVSEHDFEALIGDLDESLSGSDSEESEQDEDNRDWKESTLSLLLRKQVAVSGIVPEDLKEEETKKRNRVSESSPLIWFSTSVLPPNIYLGIYRAILTNSEQESEATILDTINKKQLLPKPVPKPQADSGGEFPLYTGPHVFMCMIGGGHFAAMVISLTPKQTKSPASGPLNREATIIAHKTFHRYTTRRKQGGAQSANDSGKGLAHSAGAGLRRYNEQALTDEVRLLLADWKDMIDTSELLFIRATGNTNRKTLFGPYDGQVLRHSDLRIRGFPFNTRRATQSELMRSFVELTRIKVQEIDEAAIAAAAAEVEAAKKASLARKIKQPAPPESKPSEEDENAVLHTTQLQALIRRSKLPALLSYLESNELSPDFHFYPSDSQQNYHAPFPLHLAASLNSPALVTGLLTKAKANCTVLNGEKKPAFDLSGDRATRDAFRVARYTLGEAHCDWEAAHVPSALSATESLIRNAREKQEASHKEEERRRAETERLNAEGSKVEGKGLGKAVGRGRAIALGQMHGKTAQEKREEEAKGLTPEMRMRLERERRARAAEERIRRM